MSSWALAVVNLTLIDLPGLTKVAVGTQLIDMSFLSWTVLWEFFSFYFYDVHGANSFLVKITDGQPDSIVHDIENMVRSYIEKVVFRLLMRNSMFMK